MEQREGKKREETSLAPTSVNYYAGRESVM